jgi:hypothetical protein
VDAGEPQRLADLEADQAAADDHGLGRLFLVADRPQGVGIGHRMQRRDPVELDARHGGAQRCRTRCDDQSIVRDGGLLAGRQIPIGDRLRDPVDLGGLGAHQGLDALGLAVKSRVADDARRCADEHVAVVEGAADIVGEAAGGHGQIRLALDQGDVGMLVHPAGLGGGLGAGGGAADDDDAQGLRRHRSGLSVERETGTGGAVGRMRNRARCRRVSSGRARAVNAGSVIHSTAVGIADPQQSARRLIRVKLGVDGSDGDRLCARRSG